MRYTIGIIAFFLISTSCFAQKEVMPMDEKGKYTYYEVVELKGLAKNDLIDRAKSFLTSYNSKMLKMGRVDADTALNASGKFIINKSAAAITHPAGEVNFNLTIEVREEKYRFWLTDFKFLPYARDRYGNFVPTTVWGVPLEKSPGKLNAAEWSNYLKAATLQSKVLSEALKKQMAKTPESSVSPATVKKSW